MGYLETWLPDPNETEPTKINGGIARLVRCWEACRDHNHGGYDSGVVFPVKGWPNPILKSRGTSCSPFTATVIGMIYDLKGDEGDREYEPMFNGGKTPIPKSFYALHNGFFFDKEAKDAAARWKRFHSLKYPINPDSSWSSLVFFGLGYEIDPKDMRRGDLVAIDWTSRHGHATFCWDVHLNDQGEVDCFLYLSANGSKVVKKCSGPGVSIGTHQFKYGVFLDHDGDKWKKKDTMFVDNDKYIQWGGWQCIPGVYATKTKNKKQTGIVDIDTFKSPGPLGITDATNAKHGVAAIHVVRLFGVAPPERKQDKAKYEAAFDKARALAAEKPPESYATGKGKAEPIKYDSVPVTTVKGDDIKKDPEAPQKAEPKKVQQKDDKPAEHQHFVEDSLTELFQAGWIAKDPGKSHEINSDETKAAVKDFQEKFHISPAHGGAGPKTRDALVRAIADLRAGKPNPNEAPPKKEEPKPTLEDAYWLRNRVDAGGTNFFSLHGDHLDRIKSVEIVLTDSKSGRETKLPPIKEPGNLVRAVRLPAQLTTGSVLLSRFVATATDGSKLETKSDVPMYVGGIEPDQPIGTPPDDGWPWDETKWPKQMRDVLAELRAEPKPTSRDFQRREVTQYGVKEKIKPGSTPVLDESGKELGRVDETSLYLADIEGTFRLNGRVLNIVKSGNVYDIYVEKVIDGKKVRKPKPNRAKFDPQKSRWKDVTDKMPWGAAARAALIPFRTLAHNYKTETPLFHRKVYIEQLDGLRLPTGETHNGICIVTDVGGMAPPGKQFDFFCGREDKHIHIPTLGETAGGSVCNVLLLGESEASRGKRKK